MQFMVLVPIDLTVAGNVGMMIWSVVRAVADVKSLVIRSEGAHPTQVPFSDDSAGVIPFSE